jgi:hypothetical protein
VGRSYAADVRLDDGRVSEAHAMVSLRGRELVLLPLRGRLRVGDRDVARVVLAPGVVVTLAAGVDVRVVTADLPRTVLAAELRSSSAQRMSTPPQVLTGVMSVVASPSPHLAAGVQAGAQALVFSDGLSWFVRCGEEAAIEVVSGDVVDVAVVGAEPWQLSFVDVDIETLAALETSPLLTTTQRLRLVSCFDSVEVWCGDERVLLLAGVPARLVAELLAFGGPVRWELLAEALWPQADLGRDVLRHRLDVALTRLRKRLAHVGVRRDLITAHRTGQLELVLAPGDRCEDFA